MGEQVATATEVFSDYVSELEASSRDTAALFGLSGLKIVVNPGAGWSTSKTEKGVMLTIDPLQVTERRTPGDNDEPMDIHAAVEALAATDRRYTNYAICHELGHVRDFMDPTHDTQPSASKSDHFFWNIVDDAVINRRLRIIPAIDECTDEVYRDILFPVDDFRDKSKHVQFMYGMLLNAVTGDSPKVDKDVQQAIDALKAVSAGSASYDISQVLADGTTALHERRLIAEQYIKPYFDAFLQDDIENNRGGNDYENDYEQYEHVMHGSDGHDKSNGENGVAVVTDGEGDGEDSQSSMQAAIAGAGKLLKEAAEEIENAKPNLDDKEPEVKPEEQNGFGAGNVMAELNLPAGDTQAYLNEIQNHRSAITAIANAFESLAVPSADLSSPRYTNKAQYTGHRLHTRRLAQAAIQLHTGTEQPIWRTVEQRGRRQDFNLDKLDIHLLVDVSGSMGMGDSAEQASITGLMLMEGLELARHNLAKKNSAHKNPDVRLQVTAFGSDHEVISPLSSKPTAADRGKTFTALRHPSAWSTIISGSLGTVRTVSQRHPDRNQLVFIISDGGFSDHDQAQAIVNAFPKHRVHIAQFVINAARAKPISSNVSHFDNATEIPQAVQSQLDAYIKRSGR